MKRTTLLVSFVVYWTAHWATPKDCDDQTPAMNPFTGQVQIAQGAIPPTGDCYNQNELSMFRTFDKEQDARDFLTLCAPCPSDICCTDKRIEQVSE